MRSPCRTGVLLAAFAFLLACGVEGRGERFRSTSGSSPATSGLAPTLAQAVSCQSQWLPSFGSHGGFDHHLRALVVFDDGSGAALFAGGQFTIAGGVRANGIVKWDGLRWSPLGSGMSGAPQFEVDALAVFDDGGGPALYAGGWFTSAGGVQANHVAKWDGSNWSPLGTGTGTGVECLTVWDDGSGPALYAAGHFNMAGGQVVNRVAKWDGSQWTALRLGLNGNVYALSVFDDGSGPKLYAGGSFTTADLLPAERVACWDGTSWSAVGLGANDEVRALEVFDDGGGPALYAGGYLTSAGGAPASHLARWDGSSWSAVGTGCNAAVFSLGVHDDGSGSALYAGGEFTSAGGAFANGFARWRAGSWSAVGTGIGGPVYAMGIFDDGSGPVLCTGGSMQAPAGEFPLSGRKWDGSQWSPLTGGGLNGWVFAVSAFDDGSGPALYAGGAFSRAGGIPAQGIARWKQGVWSALGSGVDGTVRALTVFDDGTGPALYAGGSFTSAGGLPANHLARWDGSTWSAVGAGVVGTKVSTLLVHDDGGGSALYVGGSFTLAGGLPANHIARWRMGAWSAVGAGMSGTSTTSVDALAVFDDGSGPALHAGGSFTAADGVSARNIARWKLDHWTALGTGTDQPVLALATCDGGGGVALYAGGNFDTAGGIYAANFARWDGGGWSAPLGGPVLVGHVNVLCAFDDGNGPALFLGGTLSLDAGNAWRNVLRFQAGICSSVGSGTSGEVFALARFDDGLGSGLCAGGLFLSCFDSGDSFLAKWGLPAGCGWSGAVVCEPGVGGVLACPCANPPTSSARGCDNAAGSGGARLEAHGHSSLSNDALVFSASGEPASATSLVLQGDVLLASGASFGQGVRCIGGALKRLYVKSAVLGSITAPAAGDASVSARSAMLGDAIVAGTRRYYGVHYRAAQVLGGCPATSTFNVTQQLDVLWQP